MLEKYLMSIRALEHDSGDDSKAMGNKSQASSRKYHDKDF